MQTARDATILTILILLFASVRIGPVAETDRSTEPPQVQTASALPFFSSADSGADSTAKSSPGTDFASDTILPRSSAPVQALRQAPRLVTGLPDTPQIANASVFTAAPFQPSAETGAQVLRWVETIEREVAIHEATAIGAEAADDSQDLMVQVAVLLEEVGDAAITELGDQAREAIRRVECPKTRFKLNTGF